MRGNPSIDYAQLGLDYKLYAAEILFNKAYCSAQQRDSVTCEEALTAAMDVKSQPSHDRIEEILANGCKFPQVL